MFPPSEAMLPGKTNMSILSIDHVQLVMPAGHESEARTFYGEILGISEVEKPEALRARGGVWFESGPVKIHLGVDDEFRPAKEAHPALVVSDLNALIASLKFNGFNVTEDHNIPGVERAFCNDPFGNRLEFIQKYHG